MIVFSELIENKAQTLKPSRFPCAYFSSSASLLAILNGSFFLSMAVRLVDFLVCFLSDSAQFTDEMTLV